VEVDLDHVFNNIDALHEPAIYVGFDDFQFSRQVLNNYLDSSEDGAREDFTNMAMTTLLIKHVSGEPDEALTMGVVTTAFLRGLRSTMIKTFRFKQYEVVSLTKPALMNDEADKTFQVNTVVRLIYNDVWETYTESHRIKKVSFDIDPAEEC
jgi:hypothetical protein